MKKKFGNIVRKVRFLTWRLLGVKYWKYLKNQKAVYLNDFNAAEIGKYTYNNGAKVWRWGQNSKLIVGNYCSIAHDVQFILDSGFHDVFKLTHFPIIQEFFGADEEFILDGEIKTKTKIKEKYPWDKTGITIGNDVWIGANAIILPNVTIGNGCTILAGAVVSKSFEDYSIIAGVPAQRVGDKIAKEFQKDFSEIGWWNWDKEKVKACIGDFNLDVADFIAKHKTS